METIYNLHLEKLTLEDEWVKIGFEHYKNNQVVVDNVILNKDVMDSFNILDMEPTSNTTLIRNRYLSLSIMYHPDKRQINMPNLSSEECNAIFNKIKNAYNYLIDNFDYKRYDILNEDAAKNGTKYNSELNEIFEKMPIFENSGRSYSEYNNNTISDNESYVTPNIKRKVKFEFDTNKPKKHKMVKYDVDRPVNTMFYTFDEPSDYSKINIDGDRGLEYAELSYIENYEMFEDSYKKNDNERSIHNNTTEEIDKLFNLNI